MDTIRLVSWNVNGFRALSGKPVEAVTGRGGGLTDAAFLKKKQVR